MTLYTHVEQSYQNNLHKALFCNNLALYGEKETPLPPKKGGGGGGGGGAGGELQMVVTPSPSPKIILHTILFVFTPCSEDKPHHRN